MKHVLITGGAQRIGRIIALALAQAGWDITLHYCHSQKQAETLAKKIRAMGRKVFLTQADFEKLEDVENIFPSNAPPVTAIVSNASLFEHDDQDPDGSRHNQVNYKTPLRWSEKLLDQLPEGETGVIVHILDNTELPPFLSAYAASRKDLAAALPTQAQTSAPRLRINAVVPGATLRHARQSETHFDKLVKSTPLGRVVHPEEIAAALLFLLETPSVTGQTLFVDSGAHFLKNT